MSDRIARPYIRVVQAATTRGAIDLIAVERAVNGSRPEGMTDRELREAARILIGRGYSATAIAETLRLSSIVVRRWYPAELARELVAS
ncbi:hypothetical protein [Streptomyces sp. NPDC087272]|uniref:hypothetical protein n=1 Tax=Streptomyces sp. NPDC087272 TaxID=3365775 RepID=UPI0037FF10F6